MFYWSIALNEQCVINIYDNFLHSNFNINERYYLHITSNFYLMLSIVYALWQTIRIITWFIIMGFNFFKYKYELEKNFKSTRTCNINKFLILKHLCAFIQVENHNMNNRFFKMQPSFRLDEIWPKTLSNLH